MPLLLLNKIFSNLFLLRRPSGALLETELDESDSFGFGAGPERLDLNPFVYAGCLGNSGARLQIFLGLGSSFN
jgi:hypothetical protein